ncbi:MAG: AraC family transcriptional regulator [Saprospiraceae bacterium]|nr:AraC family transcriptional regulator [Saprospiraceae bacterium]
MLNLHHALRSIRTYRKVEIEELLFVEYKCPDQEQFFEFWMEVGCLVYCTAGKKIYRSGAVDLQVEPGSVFFMKKGAYTGQNFFDETYCALLFFLPDEFIQQFLLRYLDLKFPEEHIRAFHSEGIISLEKEVVLETFFYSILQYLSGPVEFQKDILKIKLDELLLNLFTHPFHQPLAGYFSSLLHNDRAQLRQIMEENYASRMRVDEYAQLCHMSLSTFKREFTKHYGSSPAKWILGRKLELSARLLQGSHKSVNEVSFQCGFESSSHFIRVFKQHYQFTPAQYRKLSSEKIRLRSPS